MCLCFSGSSPDVPHSFRWNTGLIYKPASAPARQAWHDLTSADYQMTFNQLMGEGYRLELVNGYSVAGPVRFAVIWTK